MGKAFIILLVSLFFCSSAVWSGEPRRLVAGETLTGGFEQVRYLNGLSRPLRSSGTFVLSPGAGLIWRTEAPLRSTAVLTPKGLVQLVDNAEAISLDAALVPMIARVFETIAGALAGDRSALERDFAVTFKAAGEDWSITLIPRGQSRSESTPFQSIEIDGRELVTSVTLQRPGGDRDEIRFANQTVERRDLSDDDKRLLARTANR